MNYFDSPGVEYTDEGFPILSEHSCGRCGHACIPDDQTLYTDDDTGRPEGLLAMTPCPTCGASIITALGHPHFMQWAMETLSELGGEPAGPTRLVMTPIAQAVGGAI